jgi:hypothetical protein
MLVVRASAMPMLDHWTFSPAPSTKKDIRGVFDMGQKQPARPARCKSPCLISLLLLGSQAAVVLLALSLLALAKRS